MDQAPAVTAEAESADTAEAESAATFSEQPVSRELPPLIAVVGRPNVGKSTLFNRLAGKRQAVVEDTPGVTRDRHYAQTLLENRLVTLIDTGGFDPASDDPLQPGIARQVHLALSEADVVLCTFDATEPPLEADAEAVALLRRSGKPVVFCANKADSPRREIAATELYRLGIDRLIPISALHGVGMGDLEEALLTALPPARFVAEDLQEADLRVAVVGRPNAGKSSLVNRLLGEERQVTGDRPGTTVDSVDTLLKWNDKRWILTDTAGIRRRSSVPQNGLEALAVLRAIRAMERSDLLVLLIDATTGAADQDAKLANLAVDRGRSVVIAMNKWDALDAEGKKKAVRRLNDTLYFIPWAPIVRISAKTQKNVPLLLQTIEECAVERKRRVTTSELNRFFEEVLARHPPPTAHGRPVKIFYLTQVRVAPPTFVAKVTDPRYLHATYRKYVENQLRGRLGFRGAPVRVFYRKRSNR